MKNSIILISALSLAAMMLASCNSVFAPDETATTGVTSQTQQNSPDWQAHNENATERSAAERNSISAGGY